MTSSEDIVQKINCLCSYVCNGKTYGYEQRLHIAAKHSLYDSAIIYAWNIFMLFIYEKVWQFRELERNTSKPFKTDGIFLDLTKNKPQDYFDGNLFSLNKLSENKQGEDAIVAKMKEVYKTVDQQIFREAQNILQKRNSAAHINSLDHTDKDLDYVLEKLIETLQTIQREHNTYLNQAIGLMASIKDWHFSDEDMRYINSVFASGSFDRESYIYVAKLIQGQEFAPETTKDIKNRALQYFLESKGFQSSEENAQLLIKPIISILTKDDIVKILEESFNNNLYGHNQILQASGIEDIFIELHNLSKNNFPEIEENWITFITNLETNGYQANFLTLIEEIRNPSGEEINE